MLVYQRPIPLNSCLAFRQSGGIHNQFPHPPIPLDSYPAFSTISTTFQSVWHTQAEFEIIYLESGNGSIRYADKEKVFRQGDILSLGPDVPHQYVARSKKFQVLCVLFKNDFIMPGFFDADLTRDLKRFLYNVTSGLLFPGEMLDGEPDLVLRILNGAGLSQAANFLLLLEKLAGRERPECFNVKSAFGLDNLVKIQDIFYYIRGNAHRNLYIDEVARAANMSRYHFSRFFNQQAGCSFSQYVMAQRVERSCTLLNGSRKSVSEIAFEVGFDSLSSFNRGFRKLKNTTPLDYRKNRRDPVQAD
jgi:AraC-like DNA-binding protein